MNTLEYRIFTLEMQTKQEFHVRLIQGREAAAMVVAGFLTSENSAVGKLKPTVGGVTIGARADTAKYWESRAFLDKDEAERLAARFSVPKE
jgi:hypothetical protein